MVNKKKKMLVEKKTVFVKPIFLIVLTLTYTSLAELVKLL